MAPKITVPMNFGIHLRDSPTHNTLKLNTNEGGEVLASSVILSFNSPVIDHMTTTLHMTSVDMLEFSEAAVQMFVDSAYSGTAEGINREIFRNINKMANVFEVAWLVEKCSEYFTEVTNSIVTPSYAELFYLFEEACFVFEKLNKKDYIELTNDKIQELNFKQQFIDKYLENADRLSAKKLDMVVELAGSDVNIVVKTLVNQLTELFKVQGPSLPASCKYLLDNMDLSVCVKSGASGYYQLFGLLRDLPSCENLRWSFDLMIQSTKKGACSDLKACEPTSINRNTVSRCNYVANLYHDLDSYMNSDELLEWISVSDSVTSLLMAIEAVLTWTKFCRVTGKQRDINPGTLNVKLKDLTAKKGWSLLPSDFLKYSYQLYYGGLYYHEKLTPHCLPEDVSLLTYTELNCVESYNDPFKLLSEETKLRFHFKHPSVTSCSIPGQCGFILKTIPSEAALWKLELCTEDKDYRDTGVHFHEEIRAENMHVYLTRRDSRLQNLLFPLTWSSCINFSDKKEERKFYFSFGSCFKIMYRF